MLSASRIKAAAGTAVTGAKKAVKELPKAHLNEAARLKRDGDLAVAKYRQMYESGKLTPYDLKLLAEDAIATALKVNKQNAMYRDRFVPRKKNS